MGSESKSFLSRSSHFASAELNGRQTSNLRKLLETALIFGLILVAVWTPQGPLNSAVSWAALLLTVALTSLSPYSARELGLTRPLSGIGVMLAVGTLFVVVIAATGAFTRILGPPQPLPWHRAWQYAIWALLQQFILQSFIYVRLESVFGSWRALLIASVLFCLAHLPSPLLTILSFLGALFFCEMFRRYRNIFPLGLVHAALGLSIAASLPDHILHHMRVGIGYLMYHG
jgi:membrane protease YdiL (CAAX protease family)